MIGVENGKVILVTHDEDWATEYQNTKNEVEKILSDNILNIYHIGSTAIKGITAKPILDIAITIKSIENLNIAGMESASYIYYGQANKFTTEDYRFVKWRDEHRNAATHHIHCYLEDSNETLKVNVLFCEYLKTHPKTAKQYDDLKLKLASTYSDDRISYTTGKTDFVNQIVLLAKNELRTK